MSGSSQVPADSRQGSLRYRRHHGTAIGREERSEQSRLCQNRPHGFVRRWYVPEHVQGSLTTAHRYAAIFGPAATKWFGFLQRKIRIPSSPNLEIVARVAADQTVFASANLFCFLSSMALMEGTDPQKKLESTYATALTKNWMVWPWVQLANFKFVPLEHRVLVVNVISLGMSSLE